MVRGCIKYAPGSKGGKKFWADMSADIDMDDVTPEIEAATFDKEGNYGKDEFTVVAGAIYQCVDDIFCSKEPSSVLGKKGWEKTSYKSSGIKDFKASDKPKPKIEDGDYDAKIMYKKNSILQKSDDFFTCTDEKKCR